MPKLRILLRIAIFSIVLNGISQALITYAVVPAKYSNESYSAEEVKKIAYKERAAGINSLYAHSSTNGTMFALLGILVVADMWISRKIEISIRHGVQSHSFESSGASIDLKDWPTLIAILILLVSVNYICG